MKARINTYAFRQTRIESARLGVLGTIAHPMIDEGEYLGTVLKLGTEVATFRLKVDEKAKKPQIDVDLAALDPQRRHRDARHREPSLAVMPTGYLVLYVSEGPAGFHVLLDTPGEQKPQRRKARRVFDSRKLQTGDVFIVSLLRPGLYEVSERAAKKVGKIKVAYPVPEKRPYGSPSPEQVTVTEEGLEPSELAIRAAQSVVFTIKAPRASLRVNLLEPDDGPRKKGVTRDKVRWTKPVLTRD